MRFYGFTSTSRLRSEAESFSFSNKHSGAKRVLFRIHWESAENHFFMNTGAFEHEEEILIYDGTAFNVLSVIDEEFHQYQVDCEGEEDHG